jgi:hypothetical protein
MLGLRVLDQHGIVRRTDDRAAGRPRELREQRPDRAGVRLVEPCGRLVGEQQRRAGRQRARDRDPLLLATGQLSGPCCSPPDIWSGRRPAQCATSSTASSSAVRDRRARRPAPARRSGSSTFCAAVR